MSQQEPNKFFTDYKNLFSIAVWLVTVVWLVAFIRADVNRNTESIERNLQSIQVQQKKQAEMEIRQAVNVEQYRQIIERLDELKMKLEEQ